MLAPNQLVSLWDMEKQKITGLIAAVQQITRIEVLVTAKKNPVTTDLDGAVEIKLRNHFAGHYKRISEAAAAAGADLTKVAAGRAVKRLRARKKRISYNEVAAINKSLDERLDDELSSVQFYCMSKQSDAYYTPEEPLFGTNVELVFSKASDNISEAGKCFAVGRYTASVFHLMRAMEVAIKILSAELGIVNVEREWGKLLSDMHAKIGDMPKGDRRNQWSEIHANLYHVKQAWRNDTMHPKATYTEEEAREVFDAVRAFMRNLSELTGDDFDHLLSVS